MTVTAAKQPRSVYRAAAEQFAGNVARHQMIPARDDGLYRHLKFRQYATPPYPWEGPPRGGQPPQVSGSYWFDLITWPGRLTINGDMGTFVFARQDDMFQFFRRDHNDAHRINPSYWAEKLIAPDSDAVKVYSEHRLRNTVLDDFSAAVRHGGVPRGTGRAIREQILDAEDASYHDGAHRLLRDFEHGTTFDGTCSCGDIRRGMSDPDAYDWRIQHLRMAHHPETQRIEGFLFADSWEMELRDWSYHFLWSCHAIVWGIATYDRARTRTAS